MRIICIYSTHILIKCKLFAIANKTKIAYSLTMDTPQSILKQYKLKNTSGRIQLLEALIKSPHPISAETLFEKTKKSVNLSTVYRTLNEFISQGIIDALHIEKGKILYEMRQGRPHHHHIMCTHCHTIEDVHVCEMKEINKKVLSNSNKFTNITNHSLEFFGTCNACSKKSLS